MKYFVWLASLSLLVLGIYCGTMVQVNQPVQAAMLSEGSFPSPDMHQGSPSQLAAERGEGSYPTPDCPPGPNCKPFAVPQPKTVAGEGSYPTPDCPPGPNCKPFAVPQPKTVAGEGSYPTPDCPPGPNCKPFAVPQPRTVARVEFLGEGSAPAPFELPGGMN